jgi:hypothetical protein
MRATAVCPPYLAVQFFRFRDGGVGRAAQRACSSLRCCILSLFARLKPRLYVGAHRHPSRGDQLQLQMVVGRAVLIKKAPDRRYRQDQDVASGCVGDRPYVSLGGERRVFA